MKNPDKTPKQQPLKALAIRGVAAVTAQNVLLQGIWFVTSLFLLNAISVADYSVMKLVFAAIAVPSALFIAGLDPIILADMGVERELGRLGALKSLFRAYAIFEIISAILIWLGFICAITFFKGSFSPVTHQYLFAASFIILSRPLQNILILFFSLYFRFSQVTLLKLYDEGVTLFAIAYFVFFLRQGIYTAILIQVIAPFISIVLCIPAFVALYRKQLSHVKPEHAGFFDRIRAHGKWSIATAYILKASDALHLFAIDRFIGREAVAIYSLADALWGYLTSLFPIKPILDTMIPQRSQEEVAARQNLIRGCKYAFLGYAVLGGLAVIGGYPFLYLFFPKYIAAFPVFLGLLFLIPRFSFSASLSPLLRAYKFQRPGFKAAVISVALTVVLAIILYPLLGMTGAVVELVVTNTLSVYIVYAAFIKKYPSFKIRFNELFVWDRYDADTLRTLLKLFKRKPTPVSPN